MGAYFDYNATSPLRPGALAEMAGILSAVAGNPSSPHRHGAEARYHVERSRRRIAKALHCPPETIIFTSGGSESINLALRGGIPFPCPEHSAIVITATEHKAVRDTARDLAARQGTAVHVVPVDGAGSFRERELLAVLDGRTMLVSLIHGNNETGVLNPVEELIPAIRHRAPRALVHVDAVQCLGRIPLDLDRLGADLVSFSAHKAGGPKGVGFLYRRPGVVLSPFITGGPQEEGVRAGTENVAGIVGMAAAVEASIAGLGEEAERLRRLRDHLAERLRGDIPGIGILTPLKQSLPNTLAVLLPGRDAREMLRALDDAGFSCSSGSACNSSGGEPSHVLLAMGLDDGAARSVLRFSLGFETSRGQAEALAEAVAAIVK